MATPSKHSQPQNGFSYVGACQALMGIYMIASRLESQIVRETQVSPDPVWSGHNTDCLRLLLI